MVKINVSQVINKDFLCTGCGACSFSCPKNAIRMAKDGFGFSTPAVDNSLCVECGACLNVCMGNGVFSERYASPIRSLIFKINNLNCRLKSRSGGAFYALASNFLSLGGVVYGCSLSGDLNVQHIRVTSLANLPALQGSKYVESDLKEIFLDVIQDLKSGKMVLFSGTGCQVQGLKNLLSYKKVKADKFYAIDLICHGNFSPAIFQSYCGEIKKKYPGFCSFQFRDKEKGWGSHYESFIYKKKKRYRNTLSGLFCSSDFFRESCYSCRFCSIQRAGDITLGDAWGIEKKDRSFSDDKGVSLMLINSEKGSYLFRLIPTETCQYKEVSIGDYFQKQLSQAVSKPGEAPYFRNRFFVKGFNAVEKQASKKWKRECRKEETRRFLSRLAHRLHVYSLLKKTK